MADLAVTAHPHPKVALPARANSSGRQAEAAFAFSLEQLLQGGVVPRHPLAADLLGAERDPMDRGDRAADEIADRSRKRLQARRLEMIDDSGNADAAPPVQQERDHARPVSADHDDAGSPGERVDRGKAGPPADPAEVQAAPQTADSGMPVNAVPQSPRHGAQGTAAPVPSAPGVSQLPLAGAAEAAEPAMTAPAPGQPAASVIREADVLVSQSSSALAPTAALAAEQFQGQGHRLRPASPGSPLGAAPAVPAAAGSEKPVQPAPDVAARLEAAGRAGGPQTAAGTAIAGAADPGATAAAAGVQATQGQSAAMAATAGTAAFPPDKTLTAPSPASASDAQSPAGIAAGPAFGGAQTAATRTAGAPTRTDPFQQRIVGDQVSVHIKKAVQEGMDRIEIRLKPEALGRVDVRLELGPEGRVVATVTADQRHTLELLRSDARSLERALQEAGLQTDDGSLNFNLRSGGDDRPGRHDARPTAAPLLAEPGTDGGDGQTALPPGFGQAAARPDGLDIHA
jgi:flagellar hook-length control protein FliK